MKDITLPIGLLKKVGFERTLILLYLEQNRGPYGWAKLGSPEHRESEILSAISINAIYRYLHYLKKEQLLELQFDSRRGSSSYRITKKGRDLMEEARNNG